MNYDNQNVRRQDRLLDETAARHLLREGEYGLLATVDTAGQPYAVPVSYVWDGNGAIYFHCAPEGEKLRAIDAHPEVMLTIVGHTRVMPAGFTTAYESLVVRGRARRRLSTDERYEALRLLLHKFCPDDVERGMQYAERSFHRTEVVRIDIDRWSGKCKRTAASSTDSNSQKEGNARRLARLTRAMMHYDAGDRLRIQHFVKVHGYAATIGRLEGLDDERQLRLEAAAIVHDIGIHLSEQKYGTSDGRHQEQEGPAEARRLLNEVGGFTPEEVERVCWLVGHHHTYSPIDGAEHQILIEADFLVNIDEDGLSAEAVAKIRSRIFRTQSGLDLLDTLYASHYEPGGRK